MHALQISSCAPTDASIFAKCAALTFATITATMADCCGMMSMLECFLMALFDAIRSTPGEEIMTKRTSVTRTTDDRARLVLPKSFANCSVVVKQLSDTELHISPWVGSLRMSCPSRRSCRLPADRDRDRFLNC